jgi:hypothetical protein
MLDEVIDVSRAADRILGPEQPIILDLDSQIQTTKDISLIIKNETYYALCTTRPTRY